MFDTFDRTGQAEFPFAKAVVFRALKAACERLNMKVENADDMTSRIDVSVGMSAFSWGERVSISVVSQGPASSVVGVQSGAKTILGSATTHGKNRKNVREILTKTSDVLRERGAAWTAELPVERAEVVQGPASLSEELERLGSLRANGVLTEDEFARLKAKLLT